MTMQPPPQYTAQQPVGPAPGVRYASAGGRLIAYIVDGIILGFVVSLFYVLGFVVVAGGSTVDTATNTVTPGPGAALGVLNFLVGVVVGILWKPFWWSRGGQTPGYKLLGMRVVRARDGGPIGFGTGILRIIGYVINDIVFGIPLGFLWVLFDNQRQGWHDKIAGTVVIQA